MLAEVRPELAGGAALVLGSGPLSARWSPSDGSATSVATWAGSTSQVTRSQAPSASVDGSIAVAAAPACSSASAATRSRWAMSAAGPKVRQTVRGSDAVPGRVRGEVTTGNGVSCFGGSAHTLGTICERTKSRVVGRVKPGRSFVCVCAGQEGRVRPRRSSSACATSWCTEAPATRAAKSAPNMANTVIGVAAVTVAVRRGSRAPRLRRPASTAIGSPAEAPRTGTGATSTVRLVGAPGAFTMSSPDGRVGATSRRRFVVVRARRRAGRRRHWAATRQGSEPEGRGVNSVAIRCHRAAPQHGVAFAAVSPPTTGSVTVAASRPVAGEPRAGRGVGLPCTTSRGPQPAIGSPCGARSSAAIATTREWPATCTAVRPPIECPTSTTGTSP